MLRETYLLLKNMIIKHPPPEKLEEYWKNPQDQNTPEYYLSHNHQLSKTLAQLISTFFEKDTKILEIGCNVGRNLHYLILQGFKDITGIEINKKAVELGKEKFETLKDARFLIGPAETILQSLADKKEHFDLIFTVAVFEHIPNKIFLDIAKILPNLTTSLILLEDECGGSWHRFPRNYKKVFVKYGFSQYLSASGVLFGLNKNFNLRFLIRKKMVR